MLEKFYIWFSELSDPVGRLMLSAVCSGSSGVMETESEIVGTFHTEVENIEDIMTWRSGVGSGSGPVLIVST